MPSCPTCHTQYDSTVRICTRDGTPLVGDGADDPNIGKLLDDKYRLDAFISEGGMGSVYRATHVMLSKTVAVKLIKKELLSSPDIIRRFQREARAATSLEHPNIVAVYDLGQTDDGTVYIAMEYIDGQSLKDVIQKGGPMPAPRIVAILRQVAGGLARAHRRQVIHRDLKPHNVMLTVDADGRETAKLLDFGIAKTFDEPATQLTMTGFVLGTPQYMSPEQATGKPVDGRSDLYSLGVILYEMLVGQVPFSDPSLAAVLLRHMTEVPDPPSRRRPDVNVPPALEAVALRCLEKDPDKRYQTAEEFAAALERAGASLGADTAATVLSNASSAPTIPLASVPTLGPTVVAPPPGPSSLPTVAAPPPTSHSLPTIGAPQTQPPYAAPPVAPTQAGSQAVPSVAPTQPGVAAAPAQPAAQTVTPLPALQPALSSPAPAIQTPPRDPTGAVPVAGTSPTPAAPMAAASRDAATQGATRATVVAPNQPVASTSQPGPLKPVLVLAAVIVIAIVMGALVLVPQLRRNARTGEQAQATSPAPTGSPAMASGPATSQVPPPASSTTATSPANASTQSLKAEAPGDGATVANTRTGQSFTTRSSSATDRGGAGAREVTAARGGTPIRETTAIRDGVATREGTTARGEAPVRGGIAARPGPAGQAGQGQAPPALQRPENPTVFLACSGAPEICSPLRAAFQQAAEKDHLPMAAAPARADVVVTANVEVLEQRVTQQFGTTFATRTYSVDLNGESGALVVPMPPSRTFSFDAQFGRERANENARALAGDAVDKVREFWSRPPR